MRLRTHEELYYIKSLHSVHEDDIQIEQDILNSIKIKFILLFVLKNPPLIL